MLHTRARQIVPLLFVKDQEDAAARLKQSAGTGLAATDLLETVPAAAHGRVDSLFVARGQLCWGIFDPVANEVTIEAEATANNEDLLNLIAVETLTSGGRVYVVEPQLVPLENPAAALFRY
jgi:hypothetical protein